MVALKRNNLVICSVNEVQIDVAGQCVGSVRQSLVDVLNVGRYHVAFVRGQLVDEDYRLRSGEALLFMLIEGRKAGLEPDELARLQQIENRIMLIESQVPSLVLLAEAVVRIADHLAPPAANIVGSNYVADRLGCTTAWVGRLALRGEIPRKCVVAGTGKGRFWKFYRKQIDDWLATRLPN